MEKEKIKISHMFLSAGLIYLLGSLGFLVGTLLAYLEKAEVEEFRVLSGVSFWVLLLYRHF
jgi:positive regulator of sigma E activity